MRAVNLIPVEERRGGSGGAGKTGGAVYGVLGALGIMVILASAWAVSGKAVKDRQAELTKIQGEVQAAETRAGELAPYTQFATLRAKRVQTVRDLAASRFNWAHALREVARTVPDNAWLTSLTGTIAPGSGAAGTGGGGSTGQLRQALSAPAIQVVGCTTSQRSVAKVLAAMRQIDGVQRVALASSEKVDTAGGGGGGGGGSSATGGDCRNGHDRFPQFELVVFFQTPPSAAAATPSATPAAAGATPTTPASPTPDASGSSK